MKIIYSNVSAVYLIDGNRVIEKLPLNIEEAVKLKEGQWLSAEIKLIEKHKKENLIYLGYKKFKRKGIKISQDINKLVNLPVEIDWESNYKLAGYELKRGMMRDAVIIRAVKAYDDLERVFNTITMRIRDWYDLYQPELSREIEDNKEFISAILSDKKIKESIGFIQKKEDIEAIKRLASLGKGIIEQQNVIENYLGNLMKELCPNVLGVAGAVLGARLISLAGSLRNLALMPYSTLQLLGAEKALFRHLRTHKKPPKHGVIITHPFIAKAKNKGKASRNLAEKISIAARIDFFKGKDESLKLMEDLNKTVKG